MVNIPEKLKYTKTHEWASIEGNIATIGVSDFAQSELGDIVFIELPAIGKKLKQGASIGSIESAKAVEETKMPVGGEFIAVNEKLKDAPELINKSPYKDGWIAKIKMDSAADVKNLLSAAQYAPLCKKE
jgi:glycine cleavage system H protein